jgi:type II secretory pathway pseudopilin PulG
MKKSITLIEVIVSAVILASLFVFLLHSFINVRKYVERSSRRLIATNLARSASNFLYKELMRLGSNNDIFNTTWQHAFPEKIFGDDIDVRDATHKISNITVEGVKYRASYTIDDSGQYPVINFNITFPEIE